MKNKSLFFQIITVIIIALICFLLTAGIAILVGSVDTELFNLKDLNFANMLPVLIIGIFISCVIVGICVLFVMRTAWIKTGNFLKNNKENGGTKK